MKVERDKMERDMTFFGTGPKIAIISITYGILTGVITFLYPEVFVIEKIYHFILSGLGIICVVSAIIIWRISGPKMKKAFERGELLTTGPFSVVRHPIYAALILLFIPGIALVFGSWLMLTTVLIAYITFKLLIKAEDEYLENKFGQEYRDYRSRVSELFPLPKIKR